MNTNDLNDIAIDYQRLVELTICENACNDIKNNFVINSFDHLQSLLVKKNSMRYLNSLTISNCKRLKTITVEGSGYGNGAFLNVRSVVISSMIHVEHLIGSSSTRINYCRISIFW